MTDYHEQKREDRQKQTAEVFTPESLVNDMLNNLPKEVWHKGKTFIDPAAGNGNLLVEVLKRKLKKNHDSVEALESIYAVDIMKDNILECRARLLKIVQEKTKITDAHVRAILNNVRWVARNRNGSLGYDFGFKKSAFKEEDVIEWLEWSEAGFEWEDVDPDLPVEETVSRNRRNIFSR